MKIQKIYFISVLSFLSFMSYAKEDPLKDRKDLQILLQERREKFDSYTSSLEKHSGIFGNKTKKDIQASNEVLINIVETDNRIISTLYRVMDLRNFEKSNKTFDAIKQNQNYENLLNATDTLSRQVVSLSAKNKILKQKALKFQVLFYAITALLIYMLIMKWRKKPKIIAQ
jgi:hypothetical protein